MKITNSSYGFSVCVVRVFRSNFKAFKSAINPSLKKTLLHRIYSIVKVTQTNFDEFPSFSWLFEEISLRTKSPRTFEALIVLVRRNYERYFAVDAI